MSLSVKNVKLPSIKVPKIGVKLPTRKVVYIVLGTVVLLALVGTAMVSQVRAKRADDSAQAAQASHVATLEKENADLKQRLSTLTSETQFQSARAESACDNYKAVAKTYRLRTLPLCK